MYTYIWLERQLPIAQCLDSLVAESYAGKKPMQPLHIFDGFHVDGETASTDSALEQFEERLQETMKQIIDSHRWWVGTCRTKATARDNNNNKNKRGKDGAEQRAVRTKRTKFMHPRLLTSTECRGSLRTGFLGRLSRLL